MDLMARIAEVGRVQTNCNAFRNACDVRQESRLMGHIFHLHFVLLLSFFRIIKVCLHYFLSLLCITVDMYLYCHDCVAKITFIQFLICNFCSLYPDIPTFYVWTWLFEPPCINYFFNVLVQLSFNFVEMFVYRSALFLKWSIMHQSNHESMLKLWH